MRIAANLNVLDEVEFIEQCIHHLRAIGVDQIVLTDLGSIDGTAEYLNRLEGDPDICTIRLRREEDPWGFPTRMYEKTIAEFEVDRVLFLDADEFWLPKNGDLKATETLATTDALSVARLNIPLVQDRSALPNDLSPKRYSDIHVVARPLSQARQRLETEPNLAWIMMEVGPKTIINPKIIARVGVGTHQIVPRQGTNPTLVRPDDLIIVHVPFSTPQRFARKLDNIERSLKVYGDRLVGTQAWHWRRWLKVAREGRMKQEFQRQALTEEQFQASLSSGTIQSVQTIFATGGIPAFPSSSGTAHSKSSVT